MIDLNDSWPACMARVEMDRDASKTILGSQHAHWASRSRAEQRFFHRAGYRAHRVPDLQLDLFAIDVYHTSPKLHTNGQVMDRLKPLVRELQKQAGLADSCATKACTLIRCRSLRVW